MEIYLIITNLIFMIHVLSLPTRDGNLIVLSHKLLFQFRFKPTYKGWKFEKAGQLYEFVVVLSLPTRDGN